MSAPHIERYLQCIDACQRFRIVLITTTYDFTSASSSRWKLTSSYAESYGGCIDACQRLTSRGTFSALTHVSTFGLLYPPMTRLFNCEMHLFTLQANSVNAWWLVFGCISALCNSLSYQPPRPRKWTVIVWCRSDRLSDLKQNQKFKGSSTNPTIKKEKWTQSSWPLTPPPATISSLLLQF